MVKLADLRLLRRTIGGLSLCAGVLAAAPASAQGLPFVGIAPLPAQAWPLPAGIGDGRWSGSYARMTTGYEAVSSKYFGSYSGPTVGFEGGRLWQEGRFVYGVVGGFDYLSVLGNTTPRFGRLAYTRDFAGYVQAQAGMLLTPDVLLYGKAGAVAVHEQWRAGPTAFAQPFSRDDIAVRPDARVGVEWAVTDRLSLAVEAGVTRGRPLW